MHGLLVIDKPVGISSRDAVDRALCWFPRRTRLGHTGTLDPLAGGVLVLCVGDATRLTKYVQAMTKTYVADVTLGARSPTDDAEGPITPVTVGRPPDRAAVEAVLRSFVGEIEQTPPAYSAAKVAGRRAYELARRGSDVELAPRTVRIDGIEMVDFDYPRLRIGVRCGKGTYIRSLARDAGERLGCGAYLTALRRTRVGPFAADDAVPLDSDAESARHGLLPLAAAVAQLPRVIVPAAAIARLRHGQAVTISQPVPPDGEVAVFGSADDFVAIALSDQLGHSVRPVKVFGGR
jgi:tRNA pseudouridine55 synthase